MKRFNDGLARGEAALATGVLLLMLVVAFAQAFLRNMSNYGFEWASVALGWLDWADLVTSKGTLWLAFLGASLAVHADKHISIDVVPRLVSPKARIIMRGISSVIASAICFALARAFWSAVLINGEELSGDWALLDLNGSVHVCDASPELLQESGAHRNVFVCGFRSFLHMLGVKLEMPGAMIQLIVPIMLVFMSVRFFGQGLWELIRVARGDTHDDLHAHGVAGNASEVARSVEGGDAP